MHEIHTGAGGVRPQLFVEAGLDQNGIFPFLGLYVIMSGRLKMCGLASLKVETKKWATAVIVHLQIERSNVAPSYDQVYCLAGQLHKVFVKKKAAGCTVYPLHLHEIGPAFFEQAYDKKVCM